MRDKLTIIILSVVIFVCGFAAGQKVERGAILHEVKLLHKYASLLEKENARVYKILYEHCRR